jgi:hypothetical protein
MRATSRRYRRGLLIGALAGGLALFGLPAVASATPGVAVVGARTGAVTVNLITGDKVTITNGINGAPSYVYHPAAGPTARPPR